MVNRHRYATLYYIIFCVAIHEYLNVLKSVLHNTYKVKDKYALVRSYKFYSM